MSKLQQAVQRINAATISAYREGATCNTCGQHFTDAPQIAYIKKYGMCLMCDKMSLVTEDMT